MRTKQNMEREYKKEKLWGLFHRKWTKDVDNKEYNKDEWMELEGLILYFMKEQNGDV